MSEEDICSWIVEWISTQKEIAGEEIDKTAPLTVLGLDSAQLIGMLGDLEEHLNISIDPDELSEHNTVTKLARRIASM